MCARFRVQSLWMNMTFFAFFRPLSFPRTKRYVRVTCVCSGYQRRQRWKENKNTSFHCYIVCYPDSSSLAFNGREMLHKTRHTQNMAIKDRETGDKRSKWMTKYQWKRVHLAKVINANAPESSSVPTPGWWILNSLIIEDSCCGVLSFFFLSSAWDACVRQQYNLHTTS